MLEKYRQLIYDSKSEQEKIENECLHLVINENPETPESEIIKAVFDNTPNKYAQDYGSYLAMSEGELLFKMTAEKFGYKLWNGKAWKNKTCKKSCPFGGICKKELIKINDDVLCYGQLFCKGLTESKIVKMTKTHRISLLKSDGSVYIDLNNTPDIAENEIFSNFFFDYDLFVMWFGDYGYNHKINGENVIRLL